MRKLITALLLPFLPSCKNDVPVGETDSGSMSMSRPSSDIKDAKFDDVDALINAFKANNNSFHIYDEDGIALDRKRIKALCQSSDKRITVYFIVDDGRKDVLKRYKIQCAGGENISLEEDFGYKNPYQN